MVRAFSLPIYIQVFQKTFNGYDQLAKKSVLEISNIPTPLTVWADLSLQAVIPACCYSRLRLWEADHTGRRAGQTADCGCKDNTTRTHVNRKATSWCCLGAGSLWLANAFFLWVIWDRGSLCNPGGPGIPPQSKLALSIRSSASASQPEVPCPAVNMRRCFIKVKTLTLLSLKSLKLLSAQGKNASKKNGGVERQDWITNIKMQFGSYIEI